VLFIDVLGVVLGLIGDKFPQDIMDDRAKIDRRQRRAVGASRG